MFGPSSFVTSSFLLPVVWPGAPFVSSDRYYCSSDAPNAPFVANIAGLDSSMPHSTTALNTWGTVTVPLAGKRCSGRVQRSELGVGGSHGPAHGVSS